MKISEELKKNYEEYCAAEQQIESAGEFLQRMEDTQDFKQIMMMDELGLTPAIISTLKEIIK